MGYSNKRRFSSRPPQTHTLIHHQTEDFTPLAEPHHPPISERGEHSPLYLKLHTEGDGSQEDYKYNYNGESDSTKEETKEIEGHITGEIDGSNAHVAAEGPTLSSTPNTARTHTPSVNDSTHLQGIFTHTSPPPKFTSTPLSNPTSDNFSEQHSVLDTHGSCPTISHYSPISADTNLEREEIDTGGSSPPGPAGSPDISDFSIQGEADSLTQSHPDQAGIMYPVFYNPRDTSPPLANQDPTLSEEGSTHPQGDQSTLSQNILYPSPTHVVEAIHVFPQNHDIAMGPRDTKGIQVIISADPHPPTHHLQSKGTQTDPWFVSHPPNQEPPSHEDKRIQPICSTRASQTDSVRFELIPDSISENPTDTIRPVVFKSDTTIGGIPPHHTMPTITTISDSDPNQKTFSLLQNEEEDSIMTTKSVDALLDQVKTLMIDSSKYEIRLIYLGHMLDKDLLTPWAMGVQPYPPFILENTKLLSRIREVRRDAVRKIQAITQTEFKRQAS